MTPLLATTTWHCPLNAALDFTGSHTFQASLAQVMTTTAYTHNGNDLITDTTNTVQS